MYDYHEEILEVAGEQSLCEMLFVLISLRCISGGPKHRHVQVIQGKIYWLEIWK